MRGAAMRPQALLKFTFFTYTTHFFIVNQIGKRAHHDCMNFWMLSPELINHSMIIGHVETGSSKCGVKNGVQMAHFP